MFMNKSFFVKAAFVLLSVLVLCFIGFGIMLFCAKPCVCIQDELYDELSKNNLIEPDKNFCVLSQSMVQQKNSVPYKLPKTAAFISVEKDFAFQDCADFPSKKVYQIKTLDWFPVIKDDLQTNKAFGLQNVPALLDVQIETAEKIEGKSRALTVSGAYAGEENYQLKETYYAVCSVFDGALENEIDEWCRNVFARLFALQQKNDEPVFIAAVGDVMVARGVEEILLEEDGLEKVFGSTLPVLQKNHLTIGNLEGAVTDTKNAAIKTYTFKFNKRVLEVLKKCGFNYFMLTNNHCYDYGEQGFIDTLKALEEAGIPTSGAGLNLDEAKKFYHAEFNGQKFSVISCGAYPVENSGFNGKKTASASDSRAGILWQSDELVEAVKDEKEAGYCVIVNVHGGEEYHLKPSEQQVDFYGKLCEAGACAVFGSHPHVLQPSVWKDSSLIVYSLGNFVFNGMEDMKNAEDSEIVRLGIIDGKIIYCEQYPAKLDKTKVFLK